MFLYSVWTVLENVANLLRVDIYELSDAITQKSMILRGEEILSPLSVEQVFLWNFFEWNLHLSLFFKIHHFWNLWKISFQALDSRDSMAMNLYACTFKWLINKINQRIKGDDSFSSIGVLDIFGFENFDVSHKALWKHF